LDYTPNATKNEKRYELFLIGGRVAAPTGYFCADELTDRPDILESMQPNWTLSRLLTGWRDPRHLLPYYRAVSRIGVFLLFGHH